MQGVFTVPISVHDSAAPANQVTVGVTLTIGPMSVTTSALADGLVGKSYKAKLAATGGKGKQSWSIAGGALPVGVKLASSGALSGTPTTPGTYYVTVAVSDTSKPANTATRTIQLVIDPMTFATASLPSAAVGSKYKVKIAMTGGKAPVVMTVTTGALPPGLSLVHGQISGTPTTAGSYTFTVTAKDNTKPTANTATATYTITVT